MRKMTLKEIKEWDKDMDKFMDEAIKRWKTEKKR